MIFLKMSKVDFSDNNSRRDSVQKKLNKNDHD